MAEERLWPGEPAPANTNQADTEVGINLGTVFVVEADGFIVGAYIRVSDTPPSGECRLLLYVEPAVVVNKVIAPGAGGWTRFDFDDPVEVVNGDRCIIYYHQVAGGGNVRYTFTNGIFNADVDSTSLHAPDSTEAAGIGIGVLGNGVFAVSATPQAPTATSGNATAYWVDPIFDDDPGGDVTAPVLSNATATETGETTAALAVDTDEGNGTLFWVVTTSATPPSGAQVAAGQDHTGAAASDSGSQAVSGAGTQNISGGASGLTAATTYWAHYVQDDAATNRSNVDSSASFTTDEEAEPPDPPVPTELPEGAGGGGAQRRGRRYPYPNIIDDGWDYDAPDTPAEPEAPIATEKPPERAQEPRRPVGLSRVAKTEKPSVAPSRALLEVLEKAEPVAAPADARVAALEAEVAGLVARLERLERARAESGEEERLLAMLLEDNED